MKYSVIIPAAGSGSRMGADIPKVLLRLSGASSETTIIARTLNIFSIDPLCSRIFVCIPPTWQSAFSEEIGGVAKVTLIHGGSTRQESVRLGVEALAGRILSEGGDEQSECVLVHDAARCCVTADVIRRVVEGVRQFGAVTAAVPVPDSLCKVSEGEISSLVDRENVWAIQTPQGFLLQELRGAHFAAQTDRFVTTDDASVVARIRNVRVVEGDRLNIKVTHPRDLEIATRISQLG